MSKPKQFTLQYAKEEVDRDTAWPVIGTAFERENGRIDILFDSFPMPQFWKNGRLVLYPKEK